MEVTVILTTYNHEKYIAQALDGVLMQETDFDYGIVVLEDCSTDRTPDILKAYQKEHPNKIRLRLAQRNSYSNKRFAEEFQAAHAPFIAMLDGDDYWTSPKKLQKQVDFLKKHSECVICFHNALRVYEDEGRVPVPYNSADQKTISKLEDLWRYNFIAGCTPMFRKNAVGALPDWFNNAPYGDWPLYLFCAQFGKIGYIDEILGVYRIHEHGIWSKRDKIEKLEALIAVYESMNANLDFRYDEIVQPILSKQKEQLALAQQVKNLACAILPPKTTVLVLGKVDEDLPRLDGRRVLPFPERVSRDTRQLFASGPSGSVEASWIGESGAYKFSLYGGPAQNTLLASVSVSHNGVGVGQESVHSDRAVNGDGPFITAAPNPLPSGSKTTRISWSTADGSPGAIYVSIENQTLYYPATDAAAIEELESTRSKGAEFLLAAGTALELLDRYPELKRYLEQEYRLLCSQKDICLIYDLRKGPALSGEITNS